MSTESTARSREAIERDLLAFLQERTRLPWKADRDLFESGHVTSLFALELVLHIEQAYGIAIEGPELQLDNFRSVVAMTSLIERLGGSAA